MIDYKVIEADSPEDLETAVKALMQKAGWKLQGGVSVAACAVAKSNDEIVAAWKYHQALIKEAEA